MSVVIHLIPYHAIGGVERAAQTMTEVVDSEFSFSVTTIFPCNFVICPRTLWNPLFYISAVQRLLRARPTILVVSLWRAYAVGIFVKFFAPRTHLVVFLHLSKHVHVLDSFLTRLAAFLALRVWADSQQTLAQRLPSLQVSKGRVISFVTERIIPASSEPLMQPSFMFWGRIHRQKCLQRAVRIFAGINAQFPNARFVVIGPDGGDLASVKQYVLQAGLVHSVTFRGELGFSDICIEAANASFYLQASESEGMAMSVVEAMQLGLVPVVTPVGEIAQYARGGNNAVIIVDDAQVIFEVAQLLIDDGSYQTLRANAIAEWQHQRLYRDDVIQACREILKI